MPEDVRAASPTTPSPTGRFRLRTHELVPVLLPRSRTASSPSPRQGFNAVVPSRPRNLTAKATSPSRGRSVLESVAFDPFSGAESFQLLLQNPETSSTRREDPRAIADFRQWIWQHFPQLVSTFQALRMVNTKMTEPCQQDLPNTFALHDEPFTNQCRFDEIEEKEAEIEQGTDEAWRLMLRYATVLSAAPGENIATQSLTRTESVYFLLNGHCELSFRPVLVRDEGKTPSPPSLLPRIPGGVIRSGDHPVILLRELAAGDYFGLDAGTFGFEYLLSTVTAGSARQRNVLGLREATLSHVLRLPYQVVQQLQFLQCRHQNGGDRLLPGFPYSFSPDAEVFLRNTFLFRSMPTSARQFLAAHLQSVVVSQQEYLFTPGQPVRVFIVVSGQLTLGAPREENRGVQKEADLELELLQAHDSVGLAEALRLAPSFDRYCVVTSAYGARVFALPTTVLLMALAQESTSVKLVHEWIAQRKSWFELRRATALAQRKRFTAEGSEHVVRLTLATQRRSKLTCSRCGWAGHVSTSSACVHVNITSVSEFAASPMPQQDVRGKKSLEGSRAARQQARNSQRQSQHHSGDSEVMPVPQQLSPTIPTSPVGRFSLLRSPAHRRLKVDSIALRALQISRFSIVADPLQSYDVTGHGADTQEVPTKSSKNDALRSIKLTQSFQRLEAALQHNEPPSV